MDQSKEGVDTMSDPKDTKKDKKEELTDEQLEAASGSGGNPTPYVPSDGITPPRRPDDDLDVSPKREA